MKKRYYLHGDNHEDLTDSWFCAKCDDFVPLEHFYRNSPHTDNDANYALYSDRVARLDIILHNTNMQRPFNPRNCLA